jgi:hypothetical protein
VPLDPFQDSPSTKCVTLKDSEKLNAPFSSLLKSFQPRPALSASPLLQEINGGGAG